MKYQTNARKCIIFPISGTSPGSWICSASSCCHPRVRSWAAAHASNALKRYMLPDLNEATMVTMKIYKLQNDQQVINIPKGIKKYNLLILLQIIGGGGGS